MARGRVLRFNQAHGFGFIVPDDGGDHVFFHVNELEFPEQSLRPGVIVDFDAARGDKGMKALTVRLTAGVTQPATSPNQLMTNAPAASESVPVFSSSGPSTAQHVPTPADIMAHHALPRPAANASGEPDDDMCDVLTEVEYRREITELLLQQCGTLSASQVCAVRDVVLGHARWHGWVETP